VARDKTKLTSAALELEKYIIDKSNQKILSVSIDVSLSEEAFDNGIEESIQKLGCPFVLANCAGASVAGEFDQINIEEFERMMRINLLGSVFPTRSVVKLMKKKQIGGKIIFIASQIAQAALHGYSAYAASKWALRGLAEAIQMELKPFHIFVSVCYPPDTDTPGYRLEMLSKPAITKLLSESGQVFSGN
jgi:3-dehydrosphinganine reductase